MVIYYCYYSNVSRGERKKEDIDDKENLAGTKKERTGKTCPFVTSSKIILSLFHRFQPLDGNTFVIFGDFLDLFKFILIFGPPDVKN